MARGLRAGPRAEGFAGRALVETYVLGGRRVKPPVDAGYPPGVYEVAADTASLPPRVCAYRAAGPFRAGKRMVATR